MNSLTEAKVKAAATQPKPYKLADGDGLHVLVSPTGKKLFQYRYRLAGKENLFAIGEFPIISLREARERRNQARRLVADGINPSHARANLREEAVRSAVNSFQCVAESWLRHNEKSWSPYYLRQVKSILAADVFPAIGRRPIKNVTARDIRNILRVTCDRDAITVAVLIRQWCSAIFRFAVADDFAQFDPVPALKGFIKRRPVRHKTALSRDEITTLLSKLQNSPGTQEVNVALRILLLTFVRPGELRNARWTEIDLDAAEWRIPASRMKMRRPHIVPLSCQTVDLFRKLPKSRTQLLVFPNARDSTRCMSPTTLNRFIERLKLDFKFSAHGFRATASTMLTEMGYPPEAIERQLAHNERNIVRASYNHATHLPLRKIIMQDWADLVQSLGALV